MTIPFLLEAKRIFSNRCVWDELGYFHQNHPYATIPFFTFPLRESEEKAYFRCGGPWLFSKKKKKKNFKIFKNPYILHGCKYYCIEECLKFIFLK